MSIFIRVLPTSGAFALLALDRAAAQPIEISRGYVVAPTKPGSESKRAALNGWNAPITAYPTYRVRITAAFAGYYGATNSVVSVDKSSSQTTMVGPSSASSIASWPAQSSAYFANGAVWRSPGGALIGNDPRSQPKRPLPPNLIAVLIPRTSASFRAPA